MHTQQYDLYIDEDHQTWSILFNRQLDAVQKFAYDQFLKGIVQLNFTEEYIPNFNTINQKLKPITGWQVFAVPGLIDNKLFFEQMKARQFAATTWIRKPAQIDYLEEPDMFHDVFGHVPLLTDPLIANYLRNLAIIAESYIDNPEVIEAIARLYWYTIEFGLVKENRQLKIYGAGILSSIAETAYCYSDKPKLISFDIEKIIATPYIKDSFQKQYFVLDSMHDLEEAIPMLDEYLKWNYAQHEMEKIF
jgi:phenylalanine-4-hydroxylase